MSQAGQKALSILAFKTAVAAIDPSR